jgi:sugar/nucleoside kinase (ribokinase family)
MTAKPVPKQLLPELGSGGYFTSIAPGGEMAFFIHARDAARCITLRRENREAADQKADELRASGYLEVEIVEEAEDKAA